MIKRVDFASKASMFIYAASATILPISLVKISEELSLNLTQGGSLGFISSIEQFLVLIFSCFVAAWFGKIIILRTALIILSVGLFLFTQSTTYLMTTFLILFIGFGQGFIEALLTPLVEDLYPGDNGKKMSVLHAFWPIGVCFSVLIFGELLSRGVSWRALFIALGVVVLLISFIYPRSSKIQLPKSRTDFSHMGEILSKPRFWFLGFSLFFAGGAESAFAFWSASYIQLQFSAAPRAGALGAALFAIGMVIGRLLTSKLTHKYTMKQILLVSSVLALFISISFFLITNMFSLFIFMFFIGLTVACFWPCIQSYAGTVMKVDTTILMIFLSCFGIPGYSSATIIMGIVGDNKGLHTSFIIAPIYILFLTILLVLESKKFKSNKNN
ncbi:MAG: MFS transporter [Spirochaetaceae bacterium]